MSNCWSGLELIQIVIYWFSQNAHKKRAVIFTLLLLFKLFFSLKSCKQESSVQESVVEILSLRNLTTDSDVLINGVFKSQKDKRLCNIHTVPIILSTEFLQSELAEL